jgi:phage terminase small subunit
MSSKRNPPAVEIRRDTPNVEDLDGPRTDRQFIFVIEYCKDFNGTQAAIRAGYAERSAAEISYELLRKPQIRAAIENRMQVLAAAAEVDATRVIAELATIAFADSRELMSVHQDSCRYCWGIDGGRQWTRAEYCEALAEAMKEGAAAAPEMLGGIGYDPRREPNPDCGECFGRGVATVIIKDSRKLSRSAARLMASVKQSKDGSIELKTLDQQAALMALGRITGVLKDRTEISGPNGAPIQLQPVRPDPHTLSNDELAEALRASGYPLIEGVTGDGE